MNEYSNAVNPQLTSVDKNLQKLEKHSLLLLLVKHQEQVLNSYREQKVLLSIPIWNCYLKILE